MCVRTKPGTVSERFFRLNGEKWDLEELAYAFEEGPETVKKIEEFHYLRIETDSEKTDEEARAAGDTALTRMNAICLVRDERFRPGTIAGIARKDPVTGKMGGTIINLECRIGIRAGLRATLTVLEPDGSIRPRQPTFGEHAFRIAKENDALREALRTYGCVQHDWRGLYTVLEAVKRANQGRIPAAWASDREIEDFESTANSYQALGPDSRHGFGRPGVPSARTTISQARALVQKILQAWINDLIASDAGVSLP